MKTLIAIRHPIKNPLLGSYECLMAILLLLLCGLALTTKVAVELTHLTLLAALVISGIHFINRFRNRRAQLQPALSFKRLNATVTRERNATSSRSVTYRIRRAV